MSSEDLRLHFSLVPREALRADMTTAQLAQLLTGTRQLHAFTMRDGAVAACCLSSQKLAEWSHDAHTSAEWAECSESHRWIGGFLVPMSGTSKLQVPHAQQWLSFVLPSDEVEDPAGRMKVARNQVGAPVLRIFSVRKKRPQYLEKLRELLLQWMADAPSNAVQGEIFDARLENVKPYATEGGEMRFAEIGIEATFDRFPPVTWPWVDLYLWFRLNLKQADRVSFRFEGG